MLALVLINSAFASEYLESSKDVRAVHSDSKLLTSNTFSLSFGL